MLRQLFMAKIDFQKHKVNHRDYKLENILLESENCDVTQDYTLLLADFGESQEVLTKSEDTVNRITRKEVKGIGTPEYMAPEILKIILGVSKQ
jgi:serine/threonine protein kinase